MICLGIEGTAHTASVGIVDDKCKILANEKNSYVSEKGGMIPRELADHHAEHFPNLVESALRNSNLTWKKIDCISYSKGPGIGAALSVAGTTARMLALLHGKSIIPVNHSVAHIEMGKKMCNAKDPLVLYVSGGNSQVIGYESGKYRVYGETLDIGVGNMLDSFGREFGLGFPAGPKLDEIYFFGKKYCELPYSVKGMDVSFSGLQTAAENKIGKESNEDLAYSLMHTAFAMLTEVTERALSHTGKKELLLTGGVGASKALQKMLLGMCKARKVKLHVCPREYAVDNSVMIAWTGILMHKAKRSVPVSKATTEQGFRTDLEEVNWV